MKPKTIAGILLMVGFASLLLLNFGDQVGAYMNFSQATETGAKAHVVGQWVEDQTVHYDRDRNVFSFYMQDDAGTIRQVRYPNPKPPNFEDAEKLVIEGSMQGEIFVAEHILVKCPSKYNETVTVETAGTS